MKPEPIQQFLESAYQEALAALGSGNTIVSPLSRQEQEQLNIILAYAEQSKAVLTVTLTSIAYKALHPEQDVRNHQTSIQQGYSGRTFDTQFITPFMKAKKFPAMAESGWLTRSLEQKVPYNMHYTGAITPKNLKNAFLSVLQDVNPANADAYLAYLLQGLILQRNKYSIDLAKPTALPIASILEVLEKQFHYRYQADGAARLPVLAIYSAYQALMPELKRFHGKTLLPLESHTSADRRSGRIGDIDMVDDKDRAFEAVEVKYGITVTRQMVKDAFEKFSKTPVNRYYILSTAKPAPAEMAGIEDEIRRIKSVHGCQLIVNGVMETLKYYLRLLDNSYEFIGHYVYLLEQDKTLKFEHKEQWNRLIGDLL